MSRAVGLRAREIGAQCRRRRRRYDELAPFDGHRGMRLRVALSPLDGHLVHACWIDAPQMVDHDMEYCFALFSLPHSFNALQLEWPAVAQELKFRRLPASSQSLSIRVDVELLSLGSAPCYLDVFQSIVYHSSTVESRWREIAQALRLDKPLPAAPGNVRLTFGYNRRARALLVLWRRQSNVVDTFEGELRRFVGDDVPAGVDVESGSIHEPELIEERRWRYKRLVVDAEPSRFYDVVVNCN